MLMLSFKPMRGVYESLPTGSSKSNVRVEFGTNARRKGVTHGYRGAAVHFTLTE